MVALVSVAGPGTAMSDSCISNGKGTSDPITTKGDTDRSWRSRSARKTMGGIPTPPPSSNARERPGIASNGRPMGPMTLSRAPGRFPASSLVP